MRKKEEEYTPTELNMKRLEEAETYEEAILENMITDTLAEELDELFYRKGTNASQVAKDSGVSKSYVSELASRGAKKEKKVTRPRLINICLAAGADLDEINHILKVADFNILYSRDEMESYIIWALKHGKNYEQIRDYLCEHGYAYFLEGKDG